jgi:hypothetical protein
MRADTGRSRSASRRAGALDASLAEAPHARDWHGKVYTLDAPGEYPYLQHTSTTLYDTINVRTLGPSQVYAARLPRRR